MSCGYVLHDCCVANAELLVIAVGLCALDRDVTYDPVKNREYNALLYVTAFFTPSSVHYNEAMIHEAIVKLCAISL